ncbi:MULTISPECIES: DUF975 family protein [unclassified Sedimentibacter]|uniref:DUF975 family protein n=1 Tax=unclassified Sedimentibacter TaxID=2649220 RepID=UPI0027DFB118|nr:DUF975 family protein [Sedimentibacter sp. MB35-C1]WMJ77639.1 DUF975 family protein [Sedimentibacter sp. MB35-C1]
MWTRAELKSSARESLKGNYWKAFWISMVLVLATGGDGGGGGSSGPVSDRVGEYVSGYPDALIIVGALAILAIAYRLLLGYSLEVGSRKYFVQLAQAKNTDGCYSYAFDGSNYKGIIATMLLRGIYSFLWTLLLLIPGIIKAYSYRMVPYILADNPNIGADKAITLSRKMMDGNKFDSFVLDLSFLGWYLLGILAFLIGVFFVNPYAYTTEAHLYLVLRKNALESEFCDYEDLNLKRDTNYFNDTIDYYNYNDHDNDFGNDDN